MRPRTGEVVLLWFQGALDLAAISTFIAGRILGSDPLSFVGVIVFVVIHIVQLIGGLLTPAGAFFLALVGVAGSVILSPWWMGLGWYFTIMGALAIPRDIMQILDPVGMWQRHVYPRLPAVEKLERMRDSEW